VRSHPDERRGRRCADGVLSAAAGRLYFAVPDIQAAHATMKERGAHFEDEPHVIARMPDHDLWMVFFRDTEGNLMGLMSEVAK
jgi:methylmalonyl-CoA/ethylmalonyl-CoA epimerase